MKKIIYVMLLFCVLNTNSFADDGWRTDTGFMDTRVDGGDYYIVKVLNTSNSGLYSTQVTGGGAIDLVGLGLNGEYFINCVDPLVGDSYIQLKQTTIAYEPIIMEKSIQKGDATQTFQNIISNGSFQYFYSGTSSQPDGYTNEGSPTVARDTGECDNMEDTPYAVKYTATGAGNEGGSMTLSNLKASTTYAVTVRAKATAGDTARLLTTGGSTNIDTETTSTSWTTLKGTFTTDATPTDVNLKLVSKNDGDIVYFDKLMIVEGTYYCAYQVHPEDHLYKQSSFGIVADDVNNTSITSTYRGYCNTTGFYAYPVLVNGAVNFSFKVPDQVCGKPVVIDQITIDYNTQSNDDYITACGVTLNNGDGTVYNAIRYTDDIGLGSSGNGSQDILSSPVELESGAYYFYIDVDGADAVDDVRFYRAIISYHLKVR
jgi:hypothetical protein